MPNGTSQVEQLHFVMSSIRNTSVLLCKYLDFDKWLTRGRAPTQSVPAAPVHHHIIARTCSRVLALYGRRRATKKLQSSIQTISHQVMSSSRDDRWHGARSHIHTLVGCWRNDLNLAHRRLNLAQWRWLLDHWRWCSAFGSQVARAAPSPSPYRFRARPGHIRLCGDNRLAWGASKKQWYFWAKNYNNRLTP